MFNAPEFNAVLARNNKTKEDAAYILGINPATLYRKMNGHSDFTRAEIQLFRFAFKLSATDIDNIFFAEKLA